MCAQRSPTAAERNRSTRTRNAQKPAPTNAPSSVKTLAEKAEKLCCGCAKRDKNDRVHLVVVSNFHHDESSLFAVPCATLTEAFLALLNHCSTCEWDETECKDDAELPSSLFDGRHPTRLQMGLDDYKSEPALVTDVLREFFVRVSDLHRFKFADGVYTFNTPVG